MALKYHNKQRANRKSTPLLQLDVAMANWIQKEMESDSFRDVGKIAKKGNYEDCGETMF
jgi:hypothetical protein